MTEQTPIFHGIRQYQVLCLLGLATVFLTHMQRGNILFSLLIFLAGFLGMFGGVRWGPILLLATLAADQGLMDRWRQMGFPASLSNRFRVEDLVLAMGVMLYSVSRYRLQGLLRNIVPPDPRLRAGPRQWFIFPPRIILYPRRVGLVTPGEISLLLISLPILVLASFGATAFFNLPRSLAGFPDGLRRVILLAWLVGMGLFIAVALLNHWRQRQNPEEVARLYLQDTLWHETRREQRRLNRWSAWARLRKAAKIKGGEQS